MKKLKQSIRNIEVKILQIVWSISKAFQPDTYDYVKYVGQKMYIKSALTGHNKWNIYSNYDKCVRRNINGDELTVCHSLTGLKSKFKQNLKFQKSNWESIDKRKPIGSRLSYINSNNIKF